MQTIPLFPLHSVLFAGGLLPLQIFEPRYVEMVSACMRENCPFGIVLIESGQETGNAAKTYLTGVSAQIVDWNSLANGLLGIVVQGQRRFELLETKVLENQSIEAAVSYLPEEIDCTLESKFRPLVKMLEEIVDKMPEDLPVPEIDFGSGLQVSGRLAEYLPIPLPVKYELLTLNSAEERLEALLGMLPKEQAIFTA